MISTPNDQIQSKLDSLGLKLPQPLKASSNIKAPSAWIRIWKDKAYISGHGPQNPDGSIAGPFGKVGTKDVSIEQGYESAKLLDSDLYVQNAIIIDNHFALSLDSQIPKLLFSVS